MKIFFCLIALATFSKGAHAEIDVITPSLCGVFENPLKRSEYAGRNLFAYKCAKSALVKAMVAKQIERGAGNAYFVYGVFDEKKIEWANPENWTAPTTSAKSCDSIPEGYDIAFLCSE